MSVTSLQPQSKQARTYYYGADNSNDGNWYELYPAWAWTWYALAMVGLTLCAILSLIGGINAFVGVTFIYGWMKGFTIMYLVTTVITLFCIFSLVSVSRTRPSAFHGRDIEKPWQVKQSENVIIHTMLATAVVSLVPLCVYGFRIGGGDPCTTTQCDVGALVYGNSAFSLLWVAAYCYAAMIFNLDHVITQSKFDIGIVSSQSHIMQLLGMTDNLADNISSGPLDASDIHLSR